MHSHYRARGRIFFEVLCTLGLAASFAGAWDQTGSSAFLASASIMALFSIYWAAGLFGRRRIEISAQPAAAVAVAEAEPAVQADVFAFEPIVPTEPEPVAPTPKKRPARKAKTAAADVAPVVEPPEPVPVDQSFSHGPLEQLFDVQPRVREMRPAFGRKSRGPRTLPAG